MDINQAIQVLTSLKGTIDSNIVGLQAQSSAIDLAIRQLNSQLEVFLGDITKEQIEATPYFKQVMKEDTAIAVPEASLSDLNP